MINIAVLGYGTVGSGVVEVFGRNQEQISQNAGEEIYVKYILDLRDFPGDPYEDRVVHDFNVILEDAGISVVCETMGGVGAAYQFTKQALAAGKSVCTSNKELVAKHGTELLALAAEKHCNYMFEASVGGGIPILRTIQTSLTAERIQAVTGILNGTTNYILSKMEKEHADYSEVLKQAQELGYAERNPEADVEGHDTCRKTAILAALATGKTVDCDMIHTEGITGITLADFEFASKKNRTIKLLASVKVQEDGKLLAMVAPFLLPMGHPLATVGDVFNAVLITGNMLGDTLYYGRGAGKLPTASAVAADVIDCARNQGRTVMGSWNEAKAQMADTAETESRFYVRTDAAVAEAVEKAFCGKYDPAASEGTLLGEEYGFFTPAMKEKDFNEICGKLGDAVSGKIRLM